MKNRRVWQAVVVFLAVVVMAGCQGLSSSSSGSNSTNPAEGKLTLSSASLNFGNVVVGSSNSVAVTATNNGNSALTIAAAAPSITEFALTSPALPLTIAAGQNATLNVVFTPANTTAVTGTLSIASDASDTDVSVALAGTGVSPGQLAANPSNLGFGNVVVGSLQTKTVGITNTGDSNLIISQAAIAGSGFSMAALNLPLTLSPGQSTNLSINFKPQSSGAASGSIVLTTSASMSAKHARLVRAEMKFNAHGMAVGDGTLTIELSGDGQAPGVLSPNPASLSFGTVQVGNNQQLQDTLTNIGGADVTVTQDIVTGTGFTVSGLTLPLTLTSGQSYTFTVTFAPQASGNASGSLGIVSNASNSNLAITLSGSGSVQGQLAVNPTSLNFGNVTVGSKSNLPVSLLASGASVTVTAINSNNAEFTVSGVTFPLTVQPGTNPQFTVTFSPQSTGTANGTLSFTSNASNSPTVSLTGNGTPQQHSVLLNWTASSSPDISGYNVYRGTQNGGPYAQINSGLVLPTTYTDQTVSNSTTYYYVTTAVNNTGQESGYSNQATAMIP